MSAAAERTDWRGVCVAFLAGVAAATALAKASPGALDLRTSMQLSLAQIGWVMSAGAVATAVLGVFSGQLSHRFGAARMLWAGLLVLTVAGLLSALAANAGLLLAGRALEGIGVIFITVAAPTLIAVLARPADFGMAMGVWALWMPAGSLLIFAAAPLLLDLGGWRPLWLSSAVAALAVLALLPQLRGAARQQAPGQLAFGALAAPGPWVLAVIFFCFSFQFFSLFTFLPTLLAERLGVSDQAASLLTALVPLFILPGNLLGGYAVQRGVPPAWVIGLPPLVLIPIAITVVNLEQPGAGAMAVLAGYGFVLGITPTGIFAQAPRLARSRAETGPILGLALSGQGFGILCGPPLAGYVVERTGGWGTSTAIIVAVLLTLSAGSAVLAHFARALPQD